MTTEATHMNMRQTVYQQVHASTVVICNKGAPRRAQEAP